jgi:hypothetical protein
MLCGDCAVSSPYLRSRQYNCVRVEQQSESVSAIAERIQLLGGVSIGMAHDVAETTLIP